MHGFKDFNDRHGYQKADQALKIFAQTILEKMRRKELIYKTPYAEAPVIDDLWRRVYRQYTGGDEFLFLIEGGEVDAVGFVVRLVENILPEISTKVERALGLHWPLKLSAGVCPLSAGQSAADATNEILTCLQLAKRSRESDIYWRSGLSAADFPEGSFQRTLYAKVRRLFEVAEPAPLSAPRSWWSDMLTRTGIRSKS